MKTLVVSGLRARGASVSLETHSLATSLNALVEIWYLGVYDNLDPGRGGVVIDAGANVGDFTMRASRWVGEKGLVVAVEPVPENVVVLKRNLARNGISNVIVVERAIGQGAGTVELDGHEAETVSMDELLKELKIWRVDSIKLDVEGAELKAIEGGRHIIKQAKHVSVETHSNELYQEVASVLASEGFLVRRTSMSLLIKRMGIGFMRNPAPFLLAEGARVKSWNLTGGPLSARVPSWIYQRKKPDWFREQSGLSLLIADRQ